MTDKATEAKESAIDKKEKCKVDARRGLEQSSSPESTRRVMESFGSCMEKNMIDEIVLKDKEIAFESKVRMDMAGFLENYTCVVGCPTSVIMNIQ